MEPQANDPRTIYWEDVVQRTASDWDRLRTLGEQVASLAEHPGWEALGELVRMKIDTLHASLLPPGVKSHVEYIGATNQEFSLFRLLELPEAVRLLVQREEETQRRAAGRAGRERTIR